MSDYLERLFCLTGKVAVVTGGGGLIGAGFCRALALAGARVAVLGRREESCAVVASEISQHGGDAIPVSVDILDERQLDGARDRVLAAFGSADILVNAAGGPGVPNSRLLPEDDLFGPTFRAGTRAVIELNLLGTILPIFAFGDALADGDGGVIVNVASGRPGAVSPGVMGYSVAKAGVEQLTRWLAVETAHRYGGRLRVNAISPGFTVGETIWKEGASDKQPGSWLRSNHPLTRMFNEDGTPNQRALTILAGIPAGRFGHPDDLVPALLWLCSPANSYVTGVVVPVDGGRGLQAAP